MEYTREQEKAIKTLDKNLLVSAGAGSGKTRVLVDRYIHILMTEAAGVDGIVAITFTNKAANEMKERIRRTASNRMADANTEQERNKWLRIKHEVEGARIGTFHGFCSRIIRENPIEAGVDPRFNVLDEIQMVLMLRNAVEEVILKALEEGHELISDLVVGYGKNALVDIVMKAYGLIRGSGMSFEDVCNLTLTHLFESAAMIDIVKKGLFDAADSLLLFDREILPQKTREKVDGFEQKWTEVRPILEKLGGNQELGNILWVLGLLDNLKEALSGSMAKAVAEVKKVFSDELSQFKRLLCDTALIQVTKGMFELLSLCHQQYSAEKDKGLFLDYSDLELKALNLLTKEKEIRDTYRKKFKFVMVDEFQDTNFLQMQIVNFIAGNNVFLVGDYKQSIYRFRGAEVEVFAESQDSISAEGGEVINLSINFRSHQQILTFVNLLFENIMPRYDWLESYRKNNDKEYSVECLLLKPGESAEDSRMEEAIQLARRIRKMVDDKELLVFERDPENPDKEVLRPVKYGDIAILFRAMTDVKIYEYHLRRVGIPFYVVEGRGFMQKQEVFDILNMLRVIYDRHDTLALAGVLRSPFFGISDETLYWLCKTMDLVKAMESIGDEQFCENLGQHITNDQLERLKEAFGFLQRFRILAMHFSVSKLMRHIILETGYNKVILAKHDGEQIYANLEKLVDIAVQFDSTDNGTLVEFIEYLELLINQKMQEAEAQIGMENDDVVRLMTVHKAKGLEFPVVIIPDMSRTEQTKNRQIVFSREYGLVFPGKNSQGNTIEGRVREFVKQMETMKEFEESQRIFYVATTRARDHLVLSGVCQGSLESEEKKPRSWMDILVSTLFKDEQEPKEGLHVLDSHAVYIWKEIDRVLDEAPVQSVSSEYRLADMYPELKALYSEEMALELMSKKDINEDILSIEKIPPRNRINRFTTTSLVIYMQCPREYFFRFVMKIPETDLPGENSMDLLVKNDRAVQKPEQYKLDPGEFGTVMHRVFEKFHTEDEFADLLELVLFERGIGLDEISLEEQDKIKRLLDTYVSSDLYGRIRQAEIVRSEFPFTISLGNAVVEGKMDKVARTSEGRIFVVDFKTNRITNKDVPLILNVYKPQADIYSFAASKIFNIEKVSVFFSFLYPGVTRELVFSRNDFVYMEEVFSRLLEDLIGKKEMSDFPQKIQKACSWCSYRTLCQSKQN
jgi:ATP-dependent helicase/nuclease subunit A